jgi:hypothetical protein
MAPSERFYEAGYVIEQQGEILVLVGPKWQLQRKERADEGCGKQRARFYTLMFYYFLTECRRWALL